MKNKKITLVTISIMALSILSVPGQALAVEKATTKISKPAISKYQRYIYRYQNGVMQRKNVDGKFVSADTRKESAFDPIRVAAYNSVMQSIAGKNSSNLNVKYVIRPNYPATLSAAIKLSFDKTVKQFGDYFPAGTPVTVIMVTEKDKDFIQRELPSIVQGVFVKDLSFNSPEEYQKKLPQHYVEGSANTLGHILAYPNLGWYSDDADLTIKRYSGGVKRWKPVNTPANMVDLLVATEKGTPDQAFEASYSIGQLFYEWLIGTYGFDKFITLIKNIGPTSSFDENIKSTYGITKAQAYEKAAPYMLRAWKKATK